MEESVQSIASCGSSEILIQIQMHGLSVGYHKDPEANALRWDSVDYIKTFSVHL